MFKPQIVVNNVGTVLERVLENFKECSPGQISIFHAIRNVDCLTEGMDAVDKLVRAGLVEINEIRASNGQILKYYRYCGENELIRNYGEIERLHISA